MSNEEALKHLESAIGCIEYSQDAALKAAKASESEVLTEICEMIHDDFEDQRRRLHRFVMVADDMRQRSHKDLDDLEIE